MLTSNNFEILSKVARSSCTVLPRHLQGSGLSPDPPNFYIQTLSNLWERVKSGCIATPLDYTARHSFIREPSSSLPFLTSTNLILFRFVILL